MGDKDRSWVMTFVMKSGATTQVHTDSWYEARDTASKFFRYLKEPEKYKSYYEHLPQSDTQTRWVVDYKTVEMIVVEEAT